MQRNEERTALQYQERQSALLRYLRENAGRTLPKRHLARVIGVSQTSLIRILDAVSIDDPRVAEDDNGGVLYLVDGH